ncbi:hypothetical protein HS088_TW07G00998 [Tripterygium wilfordii]|uniref:Uncharacterized protein n=2 Tax=Tripterygium wilfordii TaxID=458696 RepID=A0A7J7DGM6_TRIWF|nr:uncharacterized protein LOC120002439 isoform X2 [Tripterygium wilfordii]XP_038707150.1 uncharacterized protein LOC120002439 isoform X2 [Tripterygium wilfordii]KAF5745414.1 hypothetical protein HS088_TW07G00998 [Tripterygium wilfordii]
MNVEDGLPVPPRGIESFESNRNGDALSPEDIAWADSCLIKDPEISDGDWNTLKDVLLEIISSQPESFDSFVLRSDSFPGVTDMEILPSNEEAENAKFLRATDLDNVVPYNEVAEVTGYGLRNEGSSISLSQNLEENPSEETLRSAFLPTYKEAQIASEATASGFDLGLSAYELEPSTEDIFKVWELEIPDEEDKLVEQLKKALSRGASPSPPSFDDSGAWKDLQVESIDDLVAGIADLSLNQLSS